MQTIRAGLPCPVLTGVPASRAICKRAAAAAQAGSAGATVGITTFDESAPADKLFAEFGSTVENIVSHAEALLKPH